MSWDDDDFEEEALTQDQLLMWSSQGQITDEQPS